MAPGARWLLGGQTQHLKGLWHHGQDGLQQIPTRVPHTGRPDTMHLEPSPSARQNGPGMIHMDYFILITLARREMASLSDAL